MNDDLRELYQEVILDHYKRPRNFGPMDDADRSAEGDNPICGDNLRIFLKQRDGIIHDIRFEGSGCAISTASASLMTEHVKGKTVDEAEEEFRKFHGLVTGESSEAPSGKLAVLGGVREFPVRVKCATLAWHTLLAALHNKEDKVTTE